MVIKFDFVESPCVNVCKMQGDFCIGCKRTLDEIGKWFEITPEEKREIINSIQNRTLDQDSGVRLFPENSKRTERKD